MHDTLSRFHAIPNPGACRAVIFVCCVAGVLLSRWPLSAAPTCAPLSTSCEVTTEVMVDQPMPHRQEVPLAEAKVVVGGMLEWTDANGWVQAQCGDQTTCTAKLYGSHMAVIDQCPASGGVSRFSLAGEKPIYSCSDDCAEPEGLEGKGVTWAARTAFHWVGEAIRKAELYVDPQRIPGVRIETNHDANTHSSGSHMACAGYWNEAAGAIEFFRSGNGCANTGENPSIVVHEWGHALYDSLYGGSGPIDKTTNEAQADVHAALVTGDLCIGRGIRPGERCHGCREDCNGLRDLGAFSLWSSQPASAATVFSSDGLDCPVGTSSGIGPLGAAPHCESLIASTAFMDLVQLLRVQYGEALGTEIAETLYYNSLLLLTSAYQALGNGTTDGCHAGSWFNALWQMDDWVYGDSDNNNGTPHGCLIFQAFDAHGIACSQPLVCSPLISAGPDRETCVDSSVSIGLPQPPSHSILWAHGAQGSPVPVTPGVVGLSTYSMTATVPGTSLFSIDTVDVMTYGCYGSFFDDFEGDPLPTWEMTGLWRHVDLLDTCPVRDSDAMYFGLIPCHYDTCRNAYGDLISDVISVPATSPVGFVPALSFLSRRSVETHGSPITTDRAEVWIEEWPVTPISDADLRWVRSSLPLPPPCGPGTVGPVACPPSDPPLNPWHKEIVAPISLEPYAGKKIRVRFHFDSLDAAYNNFVGWLIDNVEVRSFDKNELPAVGVPPTLTIVSPANGATLPCCECATFQASAVDSLGNDISDQVVWSSDINGELGSGRGIQMVLSPTLPPGQPPSPGDDRQEYHTITATVVDRAGQRSSTQFALRVPDDGLECKLLSLDGAEIRRNCAGGGDR